MCLYIKWCILLIFGVLSFGVYGTSDREFPPHFRFGIATAAYQVEGAWNESGKGESVWDHFTHTRPHRIKDHSTGDVACDSYHLYKRDVEMLVELGVKYYRFSIAWTRLLPQGFPTKISKEGLQYYNNLIDELIKNNIEPMVTILHWDTPQVFQQMGGWTNSLLIDYYVDYARILFEEFGDRVKEWITFNEPFNMCNFGYGTTQGFLVFAPDLGIPGIAEYQCIHNVIKAHAKVYHMYNEHFRAKQNGKLGMANVVMWAEPESNSTEHLMNAEKAVQFNTGWVSHPIFTKEGDYPKVFKDEIDTLSKRQGYTKSRLPKFTQEEVEYIRGTYDFIGINYYTAFIFNNDGKRPDKEVPSFENDLGFNFYQDPKWEQGASAWLKLRPSGLRDTINWIAKEYGNAEIYILENGYSSRGGLVDYERINYFNDHLSAVLDAIDDGCNVTAYTAWSLMDNFEWFNGYTERFGLFEVDFKSPQKTRTARMSAAAYRSIIETRKLNFTVPVFDYINKEVETFNYLIVIFGIIISIILILIVIKFRMYMKRKRLSKS